MYSFIVFAVDCFEFPKRYIIIIIIRLYDRMRIRPVREPFPVFGGRKKRITKFRHKSLFSYIC